jgi:hypothetical protein
VQNNIPFAKEFSKIESEVDLYSENYNALIMNLESDLKEIADFETQENVETTEQRLSLPTLNASVSDVSIFKKHKRAASWAAPSLTKPEEHHQLKRTNSF